MKFIIPVFIMVAVMGCSSKKGEDRELTPLNTPAASPSAEPFLYTDLKGKVYLSWIEKKDSTHVFKYSTLDNGAWETPVTIAESNSWFVNWADYPMIATHDGRQILAHILDKSGESTYAYDVKMFSSEDNGTTWDQSFVIHDDGKQAEHGFVSMVPYGENIFITWLDGRNTVMEGMENMQHHEGHAGAMSLRGAIVDYSGNKTGEWELDNKTCDCCQTASAITDNGPVVVYRDRSDEEIRDMSIVRWVDSTWTKPQTIYADNWKIAGCPVNGPRIASMGNTLAIAWFGIVEEQAQVKVIFSSDGGETFAEPIRLDEGKPIGRVDIEMIDANKAAVSWMEGTEIKIVTVDTNGKKGTSSVVATSSEARSSGFPQLARNGSELIVAWTDDAEKKVKTASIKL